jgi:phosphate transport system permease protein
MSGVTTAGARPRPALPGPALHAGVATRLARRRRVTDHVVAGLCIAATVVGLLLLASILFTLIYRGIAGMSLGVLYKNTAPAGSNGGLANAIVGTILQTVVGTAIGTPIGLMVGTYLSEYARGSWLGEAVRFVSDVLLSAPSILIGLFVYQLVVLPAGGFSGIAGCIALAVIVIPIVVRTTEDMLQLIPISLREAAVALGAPKWKSIVFVCYRAASDGIMTGVLLAVARIAGETAPLLFTSLGNLNATVDFSHPLTLITAFGTAMSSLPVTIYQYAGSAYSDLVDLSWVAALLITVGVLVLNIVARLVLRGRK